MRMYVLEDLFVVWAEMEGIPVPLAPSHGIATREDVPSSMINPVSSSNFIPPSRPQSNSRECTDIPFSDSANIFSAESILDCGRTPRLANPFLFDLALESGAEKADVPTGSYEAWDDTDDDDAADDRAWLKFKLSVPSASSSGCGERESRIGTEPEVQLPPTILMTKKIPS
jgi:hypothetical protein